jgi:D-alanine--poly(phosphoribitol) ligase subunit 1
LKQLYDLVGGTVDLENVYGPTETTCICSCHTIRESDFDDMASLATLGYLAPNFDYEILCQDERPGFGELLLTGPQVGLGYYNDPERTAAAFIQNPANNLFRELGYRTGDLVERDGDGRLHFRGRVDFQIKHLGYRIELEEVEAALNRVEGVREAAALYRRMGDGLGMIVAFAAVDDDLKGSAIIDTLRTLLPVYMVPAKIETRAQLPKNANGKIDRPALQAELGS